jgi:hypothetical protein
VAGIKVEVFNADRGDCILISCIGDKVSNILIDFGIQATYTDCVKSRLEEINNLGQQLDLLVLTHVDDDHIGGAIPFIVDNGDSSSPKRIRVGDIWLNTYRHLSHERVTGSIEQKVRGTIERQISLPVSDSGSNISATDGTKLAGLLYKYEYPWNVAFGGEAIKYSGSPIYINEEVKITVLTPTNEQLNNLQRDWLEILRRSFPEVILNDDKLLDDAALYASRFLEDGHVIDDVEPISKDPIEFDVGKFSEDPSVINASSITFILEFHDLRILFLADSPPSVILKQLQALYPEMSPDEPLYFDAVKVSHHGSKRNTNIEIMKHISSNCFIFSACGTYGHPHMETVSRILLNSPGDFIRNLFFNNETVTSRYLFRDDWMHKYNYACHLGQSIIRLPLVKRKNKEENIYEG